MEEKILIKRAKHGDADAFAALYEKIYKRLYQFALYTLRNEQDAQDAVSETVLDAFRSIKKLKTESAFYSWIFQILSSKCKGKMRDYYRNEVEWSQADRYEETAQTFYPEEAIDLKESFSKLESDERMIIAMHVLFGYKSREIAEVLHMNENTVRSKESRALKKMEASCSV